MLLLNIFVENMMHFFQDELMNRKIEYWDIWNCNILK